MSRSTPSPVIVDVRPLLAAGEEPFQHLRKAVDRLAAGQTLVVIAPFLPSPLIEKLHSEGFVAQPTRRADGAWETRFTRGSP